jgi:hypothetical protein
VDSEKQKTRAHRGGRVQAGEKKRKMCFVSACLCRPNKHDTALRIGAVGMVLELVAGLDHVARRLSRRWRKSTAVIF